jgi:GT2 family glycosyltransferase
MTHVSILIVDYNGLEDTRECLRSLKKIEHSGFTFSVIVVDNGSKEPVVVSAADQPENTHILRSDSNLGFTSGNNLGYEYAKEHYHPDYILLLNNDTVVEKDFLSNLLTCVKHNDKLGLVAPKIYFFSGREFHTDSYQKEEQGKVLWYAGGSIDWKNLDAFHRGVDEVDRGQFDTQKESEFATGCAVLIPQEVIEKIGFFEETYFLYLEDVDLSMRAQLAGYPVYFCPESVVWHKNAGSTGGSGSALQQYYLTRNRLYFFFKYGSLRIKLTTLRFAFRLLFNGTSIERSGVIDCLIGQMGKKPLL